MKTIIKLSAVLLGLAVTSLVNAQTLKTPTYLINISQDCPEYDVVCSNVKYQSKNLKNNQRITLYGKSLHSTCKDGSPCAFQGYEFKNGRYNYFVTANGQLTVSKNGKILLSEKGRWVK